MTPTEQLFWHYLKPILEEQKTPHGVVYIKMSDGNGFDRLMADSRSEDIYPGIYVLRPKYTGQLIDNHLILARFDMQLYVFVTNDHSDENSQDVAYEHAERIIASIVKRLQHDRFVYKNYLEFDSIGVEPVIYETGMDSTSGYYLRCTVGLPANEIFC